MLPRSKNLLEKPVSNAFAVQLSQMVITAIKQQLKLTDRYSIFIDDRFCFSLSSQKLLEQKLYKGQIIEQLQLKALQKIAANDKLYARALSYCTSRLHSQKEVDIYLERKQADANARQDIINRLKQLGLVDDTVFARTWINNRQLRSFSQRRIIQELRQKGVEDSIISEVTSAGGSNDEAAITEIVRKKRQQSKYANDDLRLMRYLAQQGFDYSSIKKAVKG
ncbi:MAG TPA: RecX family transcriptional regulator [Candidatus Saccharimonadales bacterium]|nr:RecX family transcriptional regulator [Candidatus Saccharimonadales bacterium]